ncbi:Hypothetical protein NTJ_11999 [Nesidiocoris tenuis]|uniref:FERM domain-containing protein n=1 Tax=Nesidiocoris tenuis TaxID=355587 RepID=A0ABN7B6C6_9HEMI|nr:Hypothetical protein NTJ_11999 [Nesidiocoris tenuis]
MVSASNPTTALSNAENLKEPDGQCNQRRQHSTLVLLIQDSNFSQSIPMTQLLKLQIRRHHSTLKFHFSGQTSAKNLEDTLQQNISQ